MTVLFSPAYSNHNRHCSPVVKFGIRDLKNAGRQHPASVPGLKLKLRHGLFGLAALVLGAHEYHDARKINTLTQQVGALAQKEAQLTQKLQKLSQDEVRLTQKVQNVEAASISPDVVARVAPATVTIEADDGSNGSGVLFSEDGLILTKAHVVSSANEFKNNKLNLKKRHRYKIRSYTGKQDAPITYYAELARLKNGKKAWNGRKDLAVLKIKPVFGEPIKVPHFIPLDQFRDLRTEEPKPGEPVFAIGAPWNYTDTVTKGIISHAGFHMTQINNGIPQNIQALQTDAACNPGNSGGGIFDRQGRLTGIVGSIEGASEGLCFASRIDEVLAWIEKIGLIQKIGERKK